MQQPPAAATTASDTSGTALPQEVVSAVDKMAEYQVRNGAQFETLIREKQRDNPKFSFLFDTASPAHGYYQHKLAQLQRSIGMSTPATQLQAPPPAAPYYAPPQYYPPPAPVPAPYLPQPGALLPPSSVLPSGQLSAMSMPVGLLATTLKKVRPRPALSLQPLMPEELPQSLPALEAPPASVLAALERYYAGEKPAKKAREKPPPRKRSRSRSRSPERRGGPGHRDFDLDAANDRARGYDRPLAAAQAEAGVREDGSALGDHGQRHVGLGGAGGPGGAAGDPADPFAAFRSRRGQQYVEMQMASSARKFSAPQ